MPELGTAYVQVIPSADGISGSLTDIIAPEAESAGSEAGDRAGSSLAEKMKSIIAAAGIGLAIKKSIDAVGDLAAYGDNIDKMSQKLGISAEAYQEWDAVLQHSGSSIEAMRPVFKTLINQAEAGSDAFQELGISQEQLAGMSQEEIFSATISALQNMEEGSERTALATKLLGRGAQELGPLLNTSAEDTEAMKQAVHDLGGVMSNEAVKDAAAYQDALQDMQTALAGLSRGLLGQFLPSFTSVMNGVSTIFSGDANGGVGMIITGIGSILTTIVTSIPQFIEGAAQLVQGVITALVEQAPAFIQAGMDWVSDMVNGLLQGLPDMLVGFGNLLSGVFGFLLENIPTWIQQGAQFIGGLLQGVLNNIPAIVGGILEMVGTLFQTIRDKFPEFVQRGFEVIGEIVAGLIKAIPDVVRAVPQVLGEIGKWINEQDWLGMGMDLIKSIADGISNLGSTVWEAMKEVGEDAIEKFKEIDWVDLGKSIIDGIVSGIWNFAGGLWDAVKGLAKKALGTAKSEIDAHSPSRRFAKEVGRWIPAGIAMGIEQNADVLTNAIDDLSTQATVEAQRMAVTASYVPKNQSQDKLLDRVDAILGLMAEYYPEMAKGDGEALFSGMNRALGLAVM